MRNILLFPLLGMMLVGCSSSEQVATTSEPTDPETIIARTPLPPQTPPQPYQPGTDPESEARFAEAVRMFEAAEFEEAAELLTAFSEDASAPIPLRADALRYLGRVQIAIGDEEGAVESMARLIELEPPIIELDPDFEPPPLMASYYEARLEFDGSHQVRSTRPQTLAIVNFTNSSITDHESWDAMQQGFASLMIHAMGPATELRVVERERIRWLLEEQNMQRDPSLIDQSTAVQAGRLLGVQTVVFGSFIVNGRDLILNARLVNVETGEILFSEQVTGRASDFSTLIETLSVQFARTLNVELATADIETRSLDAALAYSEGLALIEMGDYRSAYEHFVRALEYDPGYTRARQRIESLRPMLASR